MSDILIIDRRHLPRGKHLPDQHRFVKRQRAAVKEAVRKKLREGSIQDIAKDEPKRLRTIRPKGVSEPRFRHGKGGTAEHVLPGNKKYVPGDSIPKPPSGGGRGREGSPDGEGEDDFIFEVSHKEFLDYLFEDLALPDLVKKAMVGDDEFELRRAGFSREGPPSKIDYVRSFKNARMRRMAFRTSKRRRIKALEEERETLEQVIQSAGANADVSREEDRIKEINHEIEALERKLKAIPFLDDYDLRFRRHEQYPVPITQAVMFCILDASGSMDGWKKEMAKRFQLLLYLFLRRNYERVEVVFIRHTQYAKEVEEEEFFYSRETGGTVISSALELMEKIIRERFPLSEWNIYGAQASDGDDFPDDLPVAYEFMSEHLLPIVQYYAYVEIKRSEWAESGLWETLEPLAGTHLNFAMAHIGDASDIYPVFRELFKVHREES